MSRDEKKRGSGDNHRGSRERGQRGEWQKHSQVKGAIEELPVLLYGDNCNYAEFKRALSTYALRVYGDLGTIIDDFEYPKVYNPEFDPDDFTEEADPTGVYKHIAWQRYKIREEKEATLREKKPQLFATIWGQLSRESEEKIMQLPQYENQIRRARDPLALWKAIRDTHVVIASGIAEADAYRAEARYNGLRQRPDETLAMFKQRTDEALAAMVAVRAHIPSPSMQAVAFIKRLDRHRFAELQVELENDARRNVKPYPASLADAFKVTGDYQVVKRIPSGSGAQTSVFVTSASNYRRAGENKNRSKNKLSKSSEGAEHTDSKAENQRGDHRGDRTCKLCGESGHFVHKCPKLQECKDMMAAKNTTEKRKTERANVALCGEAVYLLDVETALSTASRELRSTDVLLDNQASRSLFCNKDLLTDIRDSDEECTFIGISGELNVNKVGDFGPFGTVCYDPRASANVLSFAAVEDMYDIEYQKHCGFVVVVPSDGEYLFARAENGLHICSDFNPRSREDIFITTVSENEAQYTKREVIGARKARTLMRKYGYASSADLIRLINNGGIINCPITAQDVYRAHKLYGHDIGTLKGKSRMQKPLAVHFDPIPRSVVSDLVMHADIMFVEGQPYLFSVTKPLGLFMCNNLKGKRSAAVIREALVNQINAYRSQLFSIRAILTDGEGGVIANESELNSMGIVVNPTGPGQHVPTVENGIRQIKERYRAHVCALPYDLPIQLSEWLVSFCISRLNLLPSGLTESMVIPREAFTGRKTDYERDLRVEFGEYVQALDTTITASNSNTPRTQGAIALCPTGNLAGSVRFYCLETGGIITRDHWTSLPIPSEVINYMNSLAAGQKGRASKNPVFTYGNKSVEIEDDECEMVDDQLMEEYATTMEPRTHIPPVMQDSPPDATDDDADETDDVNDGPTVPCDESYRFMQPVMAENATTDVISDGQYANNVGDEHAVVSDGDASIASAGAGIADDVTTENPHPYNTRYKGTMRPRVSHKHYGYRLSVKKGLKMFGAQAMESMLKEIMQLVDKKVFEPLDTKTLSKTQWKKIIRSSMFLKEKYLSTGVFEKLKARLVAGGDGQDKSLYDDLSSPTVSISSLFMLAAIAKKEKRIVATADIGGAYLNADMGDVEVLMRLDPVLAGMLVSVVPEYLCFLNRDGSMVVRLRKALYGCVESARLWYQHISKILESMGFIKNEYDQCVFNKSVDGVQITIALYVDDLFITSASQDLIDSTLSELQRIFQEINIHRGAIHSYLGITFDFEDPTVAKITMEGYVEDYLKTYEVTGTAVTPASNDLFKISDSPVLCEEEREKFHSQVAKLLYLAKRTRPDILTAVSFLSSRVTCATEADRKKLERVHKYLNYEPDLGINLRVGDDGVKVISYIDASYGVHADGKSHSGTIITLGAGPVFVRSSKQKIVTKSSSEAELVALSDNASHVIWARNFIIAQGYDPGPAVIYQDNKSTMAMVEKGRSNSDRTRHIAIRYYFVKDRQDSKEISIGYMPTQSMLSDMLTKPLQGTAFRAMREAVLNWSC